MFLIFSFNPMKSLKRLYPNSEGETLKNGSKDLVILEHVVEGFPEVFRHLLNFELFTLNLFLNVVNLFCYGKIF